MNKNMLRFVVVGLLAVSSVFAQEDALSAAVGDKYVISARAGGVNYTEGKVTLARANNRSGYLLKGDTLAVGDRVSTGADGRTEILLNPGSYIRLGENSSFEFRTTTLDDLTVYLASGSAMFEVFADNDFRVVVNTKKAKIDLVQSGIYRVDVLSDGSAKVAVWKGKALIAGNTVKGGNEATVRGSSVTRAKFDRDEKDALESWSKTRAKELAKISTKVKHNALRPTLLNSFYGGHWNMYNFGLWVYDPFRRSFCFLPFGYGWNSPYGYGFGYNIWHYNLPWYIYNPPASSPIKVPSRQPTASDAATSSPRGDAPFIKMQPDAGTTRGNTRLPPVDLAPFPTIPAPVVVPPPASTTRTKSKDN